MTDKNTQWPGITSRVCAAIFGGYILAALCGALMAVALPMARSEAALTGIMTSFLVLCGAVMWVFYATTALRAWVGLAVPSGVFAFLILILESGVSI